MRLILLLPLALCIPEVACAQKDDAGLAKAINIDKLNTEKDETDPYVMADGLTLLYSSDKTGRFEIGLSKRTSLTQAWTAGKPYFGMADTDLRTPFFFKGFQYFAHNHIPDEKFAKLKNFDIARRVDEQAPIPILGISEPEDEQRPWVTATGAEFHFSRKTKEGWIQMIADGPSPGPIGKARPVGFPPGFSHGTLTASGLTMYLQGPLEEERLGIFRATRPRIGGAWTRPESLKKLNHPGAKRGDLAPCVTSDGSRLYFASDRPGGKGGLDLWTVSVSLLK